MSASLSRRTRRPGHAAGASGFTLLEVLVALAILSLAVVTAIQLFAGGLRLLRLAGEHERAASIADQKLREVQEFTEGQESGTEGEFSWERSVRIAEVPAELTINSQKPYHVYAITVQVRWGDKRSIEVATLKTAHPPEPGEARP